MKVKDLIKKLEKYNPEMNVLGEYDMDGDFFMVKVDIDEIYKGDGNDDSSYDEDNDEEFVIIKLQETRD
jgi:hypothetical protein